MDRPPTPRLLMAASPSPSELRRRTRNPLSDTPLGGRILSASQLPLFLLRPPRGYGVLTTRGRRTGKRRRRCIRAVREGDQAVIVAIDDGREIKGWVANALANERVGLRLPGGWFAGPARLAQEPAELARAREAYTRRVYPFDYLAFTNHCKGRPSETAIATLLADWFDRGKALVVDLDVDQRARQDSNL